MNMLESGIQDLIPFLNRLREKRIHFVIESCNDDSVMVTLTLVGARVEVDFFADRVEYSVFRGSEAVLDDEAELFALIEERG